MTKIETIILKGRCATSTCKDFLSNLLSYNKAISHLQPEANAKSYGFPSLINNANTFQTQHFLQMHVDKTKGLQSKWRLWAPWPRGWWEATIVLTGVCLIVRKVIYIQNISTHVREWLSILLHVVLMSINICLRALYIMDNNVGALQTIPLEGATPNSAGEQAGKSFRGSQDAPRLSYANKTRGWWGELSDWTQKMSWGGETIWKGKAASEWVEGGVWVTGTCSWILMQKKDSHEDALRDFGQVA